MANSYDLTEDKRNSLLDYPNTLQNGVGVSHYDETTMIHTLIALRNSAWSLKNHRMVDHINTYLSLYG